MLPQAPCLHARRSPPARGFASWLWGRQEGRALPCVPDDKFESWIGVLAPAGMPKAELDKLNAAINKALALPGVQERLTRLGVWSLARR